MTMPAGDIAGVYGPFPASTVLDSNGNGFVRIQAQGQKLQITSSRVAASTAVKEAICTIFKNNIGQQYQIEGSLSGSTGDTTDTVFYLNDGEAIIFAWSGGDVGATATAIVSGWASVPGRGFRAIH
jgi:hypothetical protein